jgi:hypothetical protein
MCMICPRCGTTRTVTPAGATNAGVQAPVAATTASASISSPSTVTPATEVPLVTGLALVTDLVWQVSVAQPVRTWAPLRQAAEISALASCLPSTRAPPLMNTARDPSRSGGNRCCASPSARILTSPISGACARRATTRALIPSSSSSLPATASAPT